MAATQTQKRLPQKKHKAHIKESKSGLPPPPPRRNVPGVGTAQELLGPHPAPQVAVQGDEITYSSCYIRWLGKRLAQGFDLLERVWLIAEGGFKPLAGGRGNHRSSPLPCLCKEKLQPGSAGFRRQRPRPQAWRWSSTPRWASATAQRAAACELRKPRAGRGGTVGIWCKVTLARGAASPVNIWNKTFDTQVSIRSLLFLLVPMHGSPQARIHAVLVIPFFGIHRNHGQTAKQRLASQFVLEEAGT